VADFLFDGTTRLITEPAGAGNTTFDVERDLYSAWKRWVAAGNTEWEVAFAVEGGTPIGATGLFTGVTFILVNGWKVIGASHDHQLTLVGNLFSDDGVVSVVTPGHTVGISIVASTAAQGISSGSGLSAEEAAKLDRVSRILEGDEEFTADRAYVRDKDTGEVLVEKEITTGTGTPVHLEEPAP